MYAVLSRDTSFKSKFSVQNNLESTNKDKTQDYFSLNLDTENEIGNKEDNSGKMNKTGSQNIEKKPLSKNTSMMMSDFKA